MDYDGLYVMCALYDGGLVADSASSLPHQHGELMILFSLG
jgi:hypothetical protein